MRFGNRTTVTANWHRWVIARPSLLSANERTNRVDAVVVASMLPAWCRDPTIWPDLVSLYEAMTGDRRRPPPTENAKSPIAPFLLQAFIKGDLVVFNEPLLGREAEYGIHGAIQEALPETLRPDLPRTISRVAAEKSFLDVQVLYAAGTPVSGRRFKLQLPDGRTETGRLGPDGRLHRTNIEPGVAFLSLLDEEGTSIDATDMPSDESETDEEVANFSVRVTTAEGVPLSGLDMVFVTGGSKIIVATDDEGVARLTGHRDPPPTVEVKDADQIRKIIAQQNAA